VSIAVKIFLIWLTDCDLRVCNHDKFVNSLYAIRAPSFYLNVSFTP
jgi:hypothetical protein